MLSYVLNVMPDIARSWLIKRFYEVLGEYSNWLMQILSKNFTQIPVCIGVAVSFYS